MRKISKIGGILLVVMLILAQVSAGFAQEGGEKAKMTREIKEVSGIVSAINEDFIAIVYDRDDAKGLEYEMALPIDEGMQLIHKRNLEQIKVGDKVEVQYEQLTEQKGDKQKVERKAKVIRFIKPGEKK